MNRNKAAVVFFGKKRRNSDPFWNFGFKRAAYHYLFKKGSYEGLKMYVGNGWDSYLNGMTFNNLLLYNEGKFIQKKGKIKADVIYDRSGGTKFPSKRISSKTINNLSFKKFCYNKNKMYGLLSRFMAKSLKIKNKNDLKKALAKLSDEKIYVIKPADGLGGKGIIFGYKEDIKRYKLEKNKEYVVQEFIDTADGIEGITEKRHDLRVIIIDGEIVLTHLRTPKGESYLANVAQGGDIKEIEVKKLPKNILRCVKSINKIVENKFGKVIYSIDFGIMNKKPYVFELNDQIGFPSTKMNYDLFIEKLVKLLNFYAKK